MIFFKTTKIFTVISILFFAIPVHSQISDSIYRIPKDTEIRVRMDNEINSKVSSIGDTFTVTTIAPVTIRGVVVLPVGVVIEGKVINVKSASLGKKNGNLEVRFETLFLSEGRKRQIEAILVEKEKAKSSQTATALTIAGATGIGGLLGGSVQKSRGALIGAGIGLGIGTSIALLQKGDEIRIKTDDEFNILLQKEVVLPPQEF